MTQGFIKGIDGLRALAVLSVILYHLNPSLLPGGFTGVDIFFVISGYVVAKSLYDRRHLTFKDFILGFYKRRILRIYPALLFCLILTSIVVILFIPNFHLSRMIDETALYAFFGLSNFALAFNTDSYFSPGADFNPFIHTWSLGVEEQYYLVFPFLFYLWTKSNAKYSLHIFLVFSLFLSYYHTTTNDNHAYYLITSRFWELAAGSVLFKAHQTMRFKQSIVNNSVTFMIGGAAISFGLLFADKSNFPLPWALFSVVGTCLLIHVFVTQKSNSLLLGRLFESSFSSHFGKLSYSLYLWHWPVFSLFRWTLGLESLIEILFALLITYILSSFSYFALETKFPRWQLLKHLRDKTILYIGVCVISLCFSITLFGYKSQHILSFSQTADKNVWSPYTVIPPPNQNLPLSGRTMYVLGDSHARAYSKMLARFSEETGITIKFLSKGGCGFTNLKGPILVKGHKCSDLVASWLETIKKEITKRDIVFIATLKMYHLINTSDLRPGKTDDVIEFQRSQKSIRNRSQALDETLVELNELAQFASFIVLDAPKPVFNYIAFRCADWYSKSNPICANGFVETREFMERFREPTLKSLKIVENKVPNVSVWDPFNDLCSGTKCSAYDGSLPIYSDGNHLSGHGNVLLYPSFKLHILDLLN